MSSFTKPLILEYIDGETWRVNEEFIYEIGEVGSGSCVTVPKGFETDFASIPRFFWRILPPTGIYGKAAVVHDFLYANHVGSNYNRKYADEIFLEAMTVLGVPSWKKFAMYDAVRCFGWVVWRSHEKV